MTVNYVISIIMLHNKLLKLSSVHHKPICHRYKI